MCLVFCFPPCRKSILSEELNTSRPEWEGLSEEAKDFVRCLLHKDPAKRPSAREALKHPWLQARDSQQQQHQRWD